MVLVPVAVLGYIVLPWGGGGGGGQNGARGFTGKGYTIRAFTGVQDDTAIDHIRQTLVDQFNFTL